MVRLAPDDPSTPLKDREGTISTPFRKIFAIICLSPGFCPSLNAVTPVSAVATVSSNAVTNFVSRLALERRLRDDLRLNAEQVAELASILAACEQSVQAAQQHPDALWRDRLVERAHRDAYVFVIPMLTPEG
jgi:hypothetical protein